MSRIDLAEDGVVAFSGDTTFRGGWLVGCDGGRSSVRKAAGFDFTGTEPEFTGYFAQVELARPNMLEPGDHHTTTGTYIYDEPGMLRMAEFDGGASHRAQPVTCEQLETVLRRVSGKKVRLASLGLATTWTDRSYLATEYRKGRVLLAGDAAHIHSPLGGQGLNLGLGDAINLGWKLAATIRGAAPDDLLDSYQRERKPVAEKVLDWSRAQVALMRPSRGAQALRAIIGDLIATPDGATYVAERVWGVGIRYGTQGDHPLVGRSAPDFELSDGTRLNEHLRDGKFLLLDFDGNIGVRAFEALDRQRMTYLSCHAENQLGLQALLNGPMASSPGLAIKFRMEAEPNERCRPGLARPMLLDEGCSLGNYPS